MRYASHIADLVGNTPLVRLNSVTDGIGATVLAKIEYFNPGSSAKDRIASRIIDAAERDGLLQPGGTIVEPTSGNTGVGLALVALQRGYRMVFVVPDKFAGEKVAVLKAYGAEVVMTPTSVPPEHPDSYYSVSDRLAREIPGRSSRTSSATSTARADTTRRRAPRSGATPTGASPTSSPGSARAARSAARDAS